MHNCRHDDVASVTLPLTGEHVGYVCTSCYVSLPPWFGCDQCETETLVTGEGHQQPILTVPCSTHQGAPR